jgi:hypothetical protein
MPEDGEVDAQPYRPLLVPCVERPGERRDRIRIVALNGKEELTAVIVRTSAALPDFSSSSTANCRTVSRRENRVPWSFSVVLIRLVSLRIVSISRASVSGQMDLAASRLQPPRKTPIAARNDCKGAGSRS